MYITSAPHCFTFAHMETEIELLNAARRMDKDAPVKIFDLYSSALYKYALRLCGDPVMADHIVGDVFAKLLEQLASGNGPRANLRSYLYETAYHRMIDERRYSQRRTPLEVATSLGQDTHSAFLSLEDQIMFKQVLHAIQNELTDDQRQVIILRFLEDFSLRETAAIIGKKEDHVKVIQSRAIAKLRKFLEHKEIGKPVSSLRSRNLSKNLGI
jgi:RNA polymerase sigma-70 factor (ECF subfamily)